MNHKKDESVASKGLTPEVFTDLHKTEPPKSSAGLKAVGSAIKNAGKYMNPSDALKLSFKINQKGGFDCPGCAWPDPQDERSPFGEYCENGMKAISEEAQKNLIGREFFAENSILHLLEYSDYKLGKSGRLTEPMIIKQEETHYQPISWEAAFELLAKELNALSSPHEAVFYTSGRTSNEAAFLYQLFVRTYGTNNLPDCSNMCHESSGVALSKTLGIGKGSTTLEDIHKADLILIFGQNPGTNHPRMLSALEKCKQKGGKIISVNPIKEAGLLQFVNPQNPVKILSGGTKLTDLYIQIPINRDLLFAKTLMKILYEREKQNPGKVFDLEFIREKTVGYERFIQNLEAQSLSDLIEKTGIDETLIYQVADMVMNSKKIIICWAMGITQHLNSVNIIQELVNLLLLKGSIGKEGAGTFPVRGHSNVQGDRTMGIWEKPKEGFLKKLDDAFGIKSPREEGYDVVGSIKAMKEGKAKVFFGMGGNFLSASPDTVFTAEALKKCKLTVHVSTKLNRSHLIHGETGLIFPCIGRTDKDFQNEKEQFITVENSEGFISASKGVLDPCSPLLKSEVKIVAEMAMVTFKEKTSIPWKKMSQDYALIRDYISKVVTGFEDFNDKISLKTGFYLPNGPRKQKFNNLENFEEKALFTVNAVESATAKNDEFLMMTIRSHDQFNTTVYGLDDRYRGVMNERRVVLINPKDAAAINIQENDIVDIVSNYDGVERRVNKFRIVYYDIAPMCIATYFPETNALVPLSQTARESHTPIYKSVRVQLQKSEQL